MTAFRLHFDRNRLNQHTRETQTGNRLVCSPMSSSRHKSRKIHTRTSEEEKILLWTLQMAGISFGRESILALGAKVELWEPLET